MRLEDICLKLEKILNGTDTEVMSLSPITSNYSFKVFSEGLYLSKLGDKRTGKNFIPVVVALAGGSYNPVPELEEADYNIQIQFFYPVRFKNDFYNLNKFLRDTFVGKILDYGEKALSNISVATYGELQNIDFQEFSRWIENTYKEQVDVMQTYMSMGLTLYLTTAKDLGKENGFILGNSVKLTKVEIYKGGTLILEDTAPVMVERTLLAQTTPASQQVLGTNHAVGFGASTSYSNQLPLMIKNTAQYRDLLNEMENNRASQEMTIKTTEEMPFETPLTITKEYFITNYSRVNRLGEFVAISLTLADKE